MNRARDRRVLAFAPLPALVLVPLAVVGLLRTLLDPVAFADRHLGVVERFAASVLQRKLTIGSIEGHVYPELDVTVRDVVLSNAEGEEPMLVLPSVTVHFR